MLVFNVVQIQKRYKVIHYRSLNYFALKNKFIYHNK